jgi:hypothetical protein
LERQLGTPGPRIFRVDAADHVHAVPLVKPWKYNQSNVGLGTIWNATGYDDSAWPGGAALFYAGAGNVGSSGGAPPASLVTPPSAIANASFEDGPLNAAPGYGSFEGWTVTGEAGHNDSFGLFNNGLEVPDGNKVSFQTYAAGVQIYAATPSPMSPTGFTWAFQAPEAVLFDADGSIVGIHYAGPTWETESGSKVVGMVSARDTVTPGAIQWLLLDAVSTDGPGVLERTTHIHRVNTEGGLAPATLPTGAGEEARVPYTAEYFFYRAE